MIETLEMKNNMMIRERKINCLGTAHEFLEKHYVHNNCTRENKYVKSSDNYTAEIIAKILFSEEQALNAIRELKKIK